jgi:hypothetical protein
MGRIILFRYMVLVFIFLSCDSSNKKLQDKNISDIQLDKKLIEIAQFYVKKYKNKSESDELLCIYIERDVDINNAFYKYHFYDSGILSENLDFPYMYVNKEEEENYVIFLFDKKRKLPNDIKANLIKDSLWTSLSEIDVFKKYRPVVKMSSCPVWSVFLCKSNIEKYEIIESDNIINVFNNVDRVCD